MHESIVAFLEQSSRFIAPAFAGDTLYPELEVAALRPRERTGELTLNARVRNQRQELVLEGRHVYVVRRRVAQGQQRGD
jgi:acyl dehydratase